MKSLPAGRPALTALLAFCLTGCTSLQQSMSGHMDQEKASEYAAMSPEEFLKTRFYTEDLGFLDHLSMKLEAEGSRPGEQPSRPTISADGRLVISVAYYTDVNFHQLTKPRQNFQFYCEVARRGRWQLVQGFDQNPIAASQLDLATAYTQAELFALNELRRQNGDNGYAPAEAEIAATTAAITVKRVAEQNAQIDSDYAGSGFRKAIADEAFGVFRCNEPTSAWSVSVLPNHIYPREDRSNQLTTPTALIAIRLLKPEEQSSQEAPSESP